MKNKIYSFITFLLILSVYLNGISLKLKKEFDIGSDNLMFNSINSLCEDSHGGIYVLDRKAFKIYKFSSTGKLISAFGNKGRGPGDFSYPNSIKILNENELILTEDMTYVSTFSTKGKFKKRIKISKGLDLQSINENKFYGWIWGKETTQQVIINNKGEIIKKLFAKKKKLDSVNAPDETGRMVRFGYFREEYTPSLLFSNFNNYSAAAVGDKYEIRIFDNSNIDFIIKRDIKPLGISKKERIFFETLINNKNRMPKFVKNAFKKKIPKFKIFFTKLIVSKNYIFVFKVKKDITSLSELVPVDLFTLKGKYLGELFLNSNTIHISESHMYIVKTDREDNLLLIRYSYKVN